MIHSDPDPEPVPKDYRLYVLVFLLAIFFRILFLVYIDTPILFSKYPYFADKLAKGEDIGRRLLDLSPVYLYCLTAIKKIIEIDWRFIKYLQTLIGALNCLLLMALGKRVFQKEIGLMAGLLYAAYGNLIILESTLEPTVLVILFNLLSIYFLYVSAEKTSSVHRAMTTVFLAGVFTGVSIITKPNFLLFLLVSVTWLLFFDPDRFPLKTRLLRTMIFGGAAAVIMLSITIRNHVKFNDLVLVTADAGKVFYHGNGKGASALDGLALADEGFAEEGKAEPDYAHEIYRKTASKLSGETLSPSAASRFWVRKTIEDILNEPKAYLVRQLKKLFYFFNDYEMHYIPSVYKEYKTSLFYPYLRYGVITSLSLLGLSLCLPNFRQVFLIYGVVSVYVISGLLFLVQSRYRTPAVPYLCLFAGYAVFYIKEMIQGKRYGRIAISIMAVGVLFVFTRFVYKSEIDQMERWQTATKMHYQVEARIDYQRGRYAEAIRALDKCIAITPQFSPAYNLRGKSHAMLGNYDSAFSDFNQVIQLSPNMAEGFKNTGFLYLLQANQPQAERYLLKALKLSPGDEKIIRALGNLRVHEKINSQF